MVKATLSVGQVKKLTAPGTHFVGGVPGLALKVSATGGRCWILRLTMQGRVIDRGLGSERLFSLAEAREKAREWTKAIRSGQDPRPIPPTPVTTFKAAALATLKVKESGWTTPRYAKQWLARLEEYAFPVLGKKPVEKIAVADVVKVLEPIWLDKNPTAKGVLAAMAATFDYATAKELREGPNPCDWKVLQHLLSKAQTKTQHRAALPWQEIPALMAKLSDLPGAAPMALRLVILNATRSAEVRGLPRTGEIDLDASLWSIPGARTKSGRDHEYPLAPASVEIVEQARRLAEGKPGDLLFPSKREARQLSDVSLIDVLRNCGYGAAVASVHGFRSSFRDWVADNRLDRDMAEDQLQHLRGDATERAYQRSRLLEHRRELMSRWASFCTGEAAGQVVEFKAAG